MSEAGPRPVVTVTASTAAPVSVSVTSNSTTSGVSTAATSCPTMLAALMSKPLVALSPIITTATSGLGLGPAASTPSVGVGVTLPVTTTSAPTTTTCTVMPGTKDSEGFLTPPPASTLLLRRTRVNSTGSSTYVIASATPGSGSGSGSGSPSTSTNSLFSGIPNPYIPLNPEEANLAGRGGTGAGGRSTTSGRSIKRPKFDDERLVSNVIGRKKDSVSVGTSDPETSLPSSPLTSPDHDPQLSNLAIVLDNSGLGCSHLSTLLRPNPPHPPSASDPPGDSPTGKGITLTTTMTTPGPPKISKGKPASFTTESLTVATMKKQRKETTGSGKSSEKMKNVDPRTGKRRYIKKKDLRMGGQGHSHVGEDRFLYSHPRTISQSSDFSLTPSDPVLTWRPQDDLTLLVNVKQTCDLKMVHMGATFSCDFKLEHLEGRWRALLYDRNVSKVSQTAINNLHSKIRAEIWANALYSKEEDDLIKTVKSDLEKSTVLLKLEELLTGNALVFIKWRTVNHLWQHWKELKEFHLLCDQNVGKYFSNESFADLEDTMNDAEILTESLDNAVYQEVLVENKHMRKKIRLAEEELVPWKIMAEQAADVGPTNGEEISYAMIRGEKVRYLMRSREITLGRWTDTNFVDVDLGLEGPNYKVSRRQAVIQLKGNGEFLFFNQGKHALFLDGEALLPQHMGRLRDQSIIQISGLTFIFLVNERMVSDLKKRLAENSRGTKLELNGSAGVQAYRKRNPPPKYSGGPPSYAAHSLMSLTRPRQTMGLGVGMGMGMGMGVPFPPRLGGKKFPGVLTRGGPTLSPASPYYQHQVPRAGTGTPGTIGIGMIRPGTNFPILSSSSPTPTIFRRSSTGPGPSDPQSSVSAALQPSFTFGDLTIRPGVPPPPQS